MTISYKGSWHLWNILIVTIVWFWYAPGLYFHITRMTKTKNIDKRTNVWNENDKCHNFFLCPIENRKDAAMNDRFSGLKCDNVFQNKGSVISGSDWKNLFCV